MTQETEIKQELTFEKWLTEARKYAKTLPHGLRTYYRGCLRNDVAECWKDYYDSGCSPQDAITEDMTYLD
jgi:hypothetical protein